MPIVYVVQDQHRWDEERRMFVPKFPSIRLAEEYGELSYLLSPTASPFVPGPIIQELDSKLSQIESEDYLLLIGNPVLIGWACAIAADYNDGRLNVLQWSNGKYLPVCADLDVCIRNGH